MSFASLESALNLVIALVCMTVLPITLAQAAQVAKMPSMLVSAEDRVEFAFILRVGSSLAIAFTVCCGVTHAVTAFDVGGVGVHLGSLTLTAATALATAAFLRMHSAQLGSLLGRMEIMPNGHAILAAAIAARNNETRVTRLQENLTVREAFEASVLQMIQDGRTDGTFYDSHGAMVNIAERYELHMRQISEKVVTPMTMRFQSMMTRTSSVANHVEVLRSMLSHTFKRLERAQMWIAHFRSGEDSPFCHLLANGDLSRACAPHAAPLLSCPCAIVSDSCVVRCVR